jgi:ankyrin repeat protein
MTMCDLHDFFVTSCERLLLFRTAPCLENESPFCLRVQNGWTALHVAAQHGHLEVAQLLLNSPLIDVNSPTQV